MANMISSFGAKGLPATQHCSMYLNNYHASCMQMSGTDTYTQMYTQRGNDMIKKLNVSCVEQMGGISLDAYG